jgi:homoserine dehydrogenase
VAGTLPVVNIGCRDLAGDRITRIEAIFNGTTHSILRAMEQG